MTDLITQLHKNNATVVISLIKLLENLFLGRPDVIPKRWVNKKGQVGYSPICRNEWDENICNKSTARGSCDTCPNADYVHIDHDLIKEHITGDIILGTYPIHQDETVTYAAIDYDDHKGNKNPLRDVSNFYSACKKHGFPLYVLHSKSGTGYHTYLFFEHPLPAHDARSLVLELLKEAGINKNDFHENSFDRIFPNQSRLSGKKLGNLIALPFQGKAMENNYTVLLDPDTEFREPYCDQLHILSTIKKIPDAVVTTFLQTHRASDDTLDKPNDNLHHQSTNTASTASEADFYTIRSKCSFINHCVDDAERLSEKEWYAVITVASRCENGKRLAHDISKPYPRYNAKETEKKIDHALKDTGPYTCDYIKESINGSYCTECQFTGQGSSPITLGSKTEKDRWSDITPLDIFGDVDIFGKPEWPENACPPVIDDFARDEAARLGVCPSMIAMAALTVAAASISDEFTVQPKVHDTKWTESARLWTVLVSEPGTKKSPAQRPAIDPLKTIEKEFYQINKELEAQFEKETADYARWEKDKKRTGDKVKPEKPPLQRKMTTDSTIEALSEIMKDNPDGILLHFDEMTRFISSMDCYRSGKTGKDRADYIELNNGGQRLIDRVKRGNVYVPNWSACILGSIQPGPAKRDFASISDDGLLQRFDVHFGRLIGDGADRDPDDKKIAAYQRLIRNLCLRHEFEMPVPEYPYKLSEEAQRQRELVKKTIKSVMVFPSTSDAFRAALEKWEGRFARYALTFHMVSAVSEGKQPAPLISGETTTRVARLMIDFLLPNAARFYNEIIPANRHIEPARWAAGFILAKGISGVSARDLYRVYREFRNSPDTLQQAMRILSASGWVEATKFHKDGRPTNWSVNPQCHTIYKKRADDEKRRREDTVIKIQEATRFLGIQKQENSYE